MADGDVAPLLTCFADCDRHDIAAELQARGLLDGGRPTAGSPRRQSGAGNPARPAYEVNPGPRALEIWRGAEPIGGTLAERYLTEYRGIPTPHSPSLRFAHSLRYPTSGLHLPAMVAAIQAPDRQAVAIHVTWLNITTARKAPLSDPRKTFGSIGNGAIRFGTVTDVIGIAEGVEDALSAQHLTHVPCRACVGAHRMHRVAFPPTVRELHIFADDDEPGCRAAERTADLNRHLRVEIRLSPSGFKGWSDTLTQKAAAA